MSLGEVQCKRPLLRYHGGKWLLAKWIISHFPPHRVYVEPFGGAASVLIRKPRSYAEVYNDLDGEIVNLFRVLRDDKSASDLIDSLRLTPFSRVEFLESYSPTDDTIELARRTVIRSFMGFGSTAASGKKTGFRSNSNRSRTTPAHDWINFPEALAVTVERLRGVVIENTDAFRVMQTHDGEQTLFYVDPPYVHDTRKNGVKGDKSQYRHEMTDAEHERLLGALRELRGSIVLSGYANPLYDSILSDWGRVERAAHADGARDRVEVLWLNPKCADGLEATSERPG